MKKVTFALVLSCLCLILSPLSTFAAENIKTHDFTQTPQRTELKSLKTENRSYYKNPDGSITAEIELELSSETDNQLVETAKESKSYYQNKANRFKVNFPKKMEKQLMDFNVKNSSISFQLLNQIKDSKTGKVEKQKIKYSEALPFTDISYQVLDDSIKEDIIIKNSSAPDQLTFQINMDNLIWREAENGKIEFYDSTKEELLFYINPIYVVTASGKETDAVTLDLEEGNNHDIIYTLQIDKEKVVESDYPLTIDPTITLAPTEGAGMDTYIDNDYDPDNDTRWYDSRIYVYQGEVNKKSRGLIKFDLSSLPYSNVSSVYLKLFSNKPSPRNIYAYRINQEWLENEADWSNCKFNEPWNQNGGSYATYPRILFSERYISGQYVYLADLTPMVNGWFNGSSPNYGVILTAEGAVIDRDGKADTWEEYEHNLIFGFSSSITTSRPCLIVTYEPDTIAPITYIASPVKNSSISGEVALTAGAYDAMGIDRIEFYANGSFLGTDDQSPYRVTWDTRLYPDGEYTLQVKAYDMAGNEGCGTDLNYTVTVNNAITPPAGLTAQITSAQEVQLNWHSSGISGVTYRVYRNTSSGIVPAPAKLIAGGLSDPNYLDQTPLGNGLTYYYCVTAVSADGTVETAPSNETAITYSTEIQSPLGLNAQSSSNKDIYLFWNQTPTPVSSYVIYRGTTTGFALTSDKIIGTVSNWHDCHYVDTTTKIIGTTYYYRIVAIDTNSNPSEPSNEAFATCGNTGDNSLTRRGIKPFYTYVQLPLPQGEALVNMGSGNLVLTSTDSLLPGNKLVSAVRRTYNSIDKNEAGFCPGWQANILQSVSTQGNDVIFLHGDGYQETFTHDPLTNTYRSQAGSYLTLTRNQAYPYYTITSKENISYYFDNNGRLTGIEDSNGNTITYTYGNNLITITDTVGRNTVINLNNNGQITSLDDPRDNPILYSYDANRNLLSATDPMGYITRYSYDQNHNLTKIITPAGTTYNLIYDSQGHIVEISDGLGNTTAFSFDLMNGESQVTDPLGNTTTFNFNPATGLVTSVTNAANHTTTNTYDAKYNLTQTTNPLGVTTNYTYDAKGNMLTKVITGGINSINYTATYNSLNLPTSLTRPNNTTINYRYDNQGNLISVTDALNYTTTYQNDQYGRRTRETDPRGKATRYTYDAAGNLASLINANNKTTTFTYNNIGLLTSITDALANTTNYHYDGRGRLVTTTFPDNQSIQNLIDGDDRLVRTIDQRGACTNYGYDAAGRLTQITDPKGGITKYAYDAASNRIQEEDPAGVEATYGYDQLNRLQTAADELGNTYTFNYDACGNMTEIIHPLGHSEFATYDYLNRKISSGRKDSNRNNLNTTTSYTYDNMGNLLKVKDPLNQATQYQYNNNGWLKTVTDALNNTTSYTYDPCGNQLSITNANNHTTTNTYDNMGNITSERLPDNGIIYWTYDSVGRISNKTDAKGQTITYTYDSLGRIIRKTYPNGTAVAYTYDHTGNRLTMTDSLGTTSYQYDLNANLIEVTDNYGRKLNYTHDQAGRRTSMTASFGTVNNEYNQSGRLAAITDFKGNRITLNYDADGNILNINYPQGGTAVYTYNQLDQMTSLDCTTRTGTYNRINYQYNSNGNQRQIPTTTHMTP